MEFRDWGLRCAILSLNSLTKNTSLTPTNVCVFVFLLVREGSSTALVGCCNRHYEAVKPWQSLTLRRASNREFKEGYCAMYATLPKFPLIVFSEFKDRRAINT